MTEDQAKQKWCPFVHERPRTHTQSGIWSPECIGSDCMAWRWKFESERYGPQCGEDGKIHGYCGLAGKP